MIDTFLQDSVLLMNSTPQSSSLDSGLERVRDTIALILSLPLKSVAEEIDAIIHQQERHTFEDLLDLCFQLLRKLSLCRSPPPSSDVSMVLELITKLVPMYPDQIWIYLKRSNLFPSSKGPIAFAEGSSTRPIIPSFFSTVERPKGRYPITLSTLRLIFRMVETAREMTLTFSSPAHHRSSKPPSAERCTEVLSNCLNYLLNHVFLVYDSWRYAKISERFEIGAAVLQVFDTLLEFAPISILSRSMTPFEELQSFLFEMFLHEENVHPISPLFSIISLGMGTASVPFFSFFLFPFLFSSIFKLKPISHQKQMFYRRKQNKEGSLVEELITSGFSLLKKLLMKRKLEKRSFSPLEQGLFEKTVGKDNQELLSIIADYIILSSKPVSIFRIVDFSSNIEIKI